MLKASCLGGVTLDILVSTDSGTPTLPGQKQDVESIALAVGGGAMNAATVLRRLGAEVAIHCAIGQDEAAGIILENLAAKGISTSHVEVIADAPTGKAVITVPPSGDASVAAARGANQRLSGSSMREARGDLLYVSSAPQAAYSAVVRRLLDRPRASGFVAFNPGIRQIMEAFPLFETISAACDLLLVNKSEAMQIAEKMNLRCEAEPTEQICLQLNHGRRGLLCMTDGARGAWLARGDAVFHQPVAPTALQQNRHSTVGAGDTFGATLAYLLAMQESPEECLRLAARNAAATIGRMDANSGALSMDELSRPERDPR